MLFILSTSFAQKPKLSVEVFKRDTSFSCITSDEDGNIYAGTRGKRLHRYKNGVWSNFSRNFTGLISWNRTTIEQMAVKNNVLWVAHSGFINFIGLETNFTTYGGIEKINLANGPSDRKNYRGQRVITDNLELAGPNTRNTVAVFPDSNGRIWSASKYADSVAYPEQYNFSSRYWFKPGGVGIKQPTGSNFFRNEESYPRPANIGIGTNMAGGESRSLGKRQSSTEITYDDGEILVSCDGYDAVNGLFKPGIMRYNRNTSAYIGKYDDANTPIPFGNTNDTKGPTAMFTDYKGRVWVGLSGGRLAVKDTSGWQYFGVPDSLPIGSQFQPHSISGDNKGKVFFGTDKGLLIYSGNDILPLTQSLFDFYTVDDGLPSNYIRATHIDKYGTLWLGTGNGICKILLGDLIMYTLKPSTSGIYDYTNEEERITTAAFDPKSPQRDNIRIAVDGTESTLFKWIGESSQKLVLKIKEDPDNFLEIGKLIETQRNDDILIYTYKHPVSLFGGYVNQNKREITLQIIDPTASPIKTIMEFKLILVKPPILLLHGLWSAGSAWDPLKAYLIGNSGYEGFMISTPNYPNDIRFAANRLVGINESHKLISNCASNGFSVGKVDVIGHSMGGNIARLGLQSDEYKHTYNKLITINSPLSGSQVSNFVFSSPVISNVFRLFASSTNNIDKGALADIAVNSTAVRSLLNGGGNLNKNKTPTHAISSDLYNLYPEQLQWFEAFIPVLTAPVVKPIGVALLALKMIALAGTPCNFFGMIDECILNKVFKEPYDQVVPLSSQTAGLPLIATTKFDDINHNAMIASGSIVYERIKYLLKENIESPAFAKNGYNPPILTYNGPNRGILNNETVQITKPDKNSTYVAGSAIEVIAQGSIGIKRLLLLTGNEAVGLGGKDATTQSASFNYIIPVNVVGKFHIAVLGYNSFGQPVIDTVSVNVVVPSGVTLDSIKLIDRNKLTVAQGDSLQLTIKGYYSDTVRDISYLNGINYTIDDVNVMPSISVANNIKGLIEGFDKFYISYLGKTDTGYIEILPKLNIPPDVVLPVNFVSFTGKQINNNKILLKWNTSLQVNNKHFEIERSYDGTNFKTAGIVNSDVSNVYSFIDENKVEAIVFYRLKQVDLDGRFAYSDVILLRSTKNKEKNIIIYPNPSNGYFTVNVSDGNHPEWILSLTNIYGQKLLEKKIAANQNSENVKFNTLPTGVYNVLITDMSKSDIIYNGKIIINK